MEEQIGYVINENGWKKNFHDYDIGRTVISMADKPVPPFASGNSVPGVTMDLVADRKAVVRVRLTADAAIRLAKRLLQWADISKQHSDNGYHNENSPSGTWTEEEHIANSLRSRRAPAKVALKH